MDCPTPMDSCDKNRDVDFVTDSAKTPCLPCSSYYSDNISRSTTLASREGVLLLGYTFSPSQDTVGAPASKCNRQTIANSSRKPIILLPDRLAHLSYCLSGTEATVPFVTGQLEDLC